MIFAQSFTSFRGISTRSTLLGKLQLMTFALRTRYHHKIQSCDSHSAAFSYDLPTSFSLEHMREPQSSANELASLSFLSENE